MNILITYQAMRPRLKFIYLSVIFCFGISSSHAQVNNIRLSVGDSVPVLKIDKWLKGGGWPLDKGKIYLIDMWATWCVPCIAGMPHLSMLQEKYKKNGVEVIGITSEDKYGNKLENVLNFIQKKATAMNYNVAWVPSSEKEDEKGIWLHPWMQESGLGNLPTSFLIDRSGKIVYIGDPFTIDETLDNVANDHYDINILKKNYLEGMDADNMLSQFNNSLNQKNYDAAIKYGKKLLNDFTYVKPNAYLIIGHQVAQIENINEELLNIGYEAATRGVVLTKFESPGFLDVLASIYAVKRDYTSAVINEKLAVSLSEGSMKDEQSKRLEKYLSLALRKNE